METSQAIDQLIKALKEDEGYYYGWQANIAMAFQDEYRTQMEILEHPFTLEAQVSIHQIANNAAKNFLNQLISL